MILKMERNSLSGEILLRRQQSLAVRAKCEMQHGDAAARSRNRVRAMGGKKGKRRGAFTDENRDTIPHSRVPPFEAQHVDIPFRRALDVAHSQRDMVDAFEFEHQSIVA